MSNSLPVKPLGTVLQKAGLISAQQIEIALREQKSKFSNKRLGEILALHGWIEQETANFFAEHWAILLAEKSKQPLGQYLKEACLLSENQINVILSEQKQTGLKFGTLAALKGWIKQTTIIFFVESLNLERKSNLEPVSAADRWNSANEPETLAKIRKGLLKNKTCEPLRLLKLYRRILQQGEVAADRSIEQKQLHDLGLVIKQEGKLTVANRIYQEIFNLNWVEDELTRLQPFYQIRIELFKLKEKATSPYSTIEAIIYWTKEHFFFTQKLCQLIAESKVFILSGTEKSQIEQLVQNFIIKNWETQIAAEPLRKMRQDLLGNKNCEPSRLLRLYQQVLQDDEIPANDSLEQLELLNLGLVVWQDHKLKVANRIYETVFDRSWVDRELLNLRPFNQFAKELAKLKGKTHSPFSVLKEILVWTGDRIALTRQLSQIISESDIFIAAGEEAMQVEQIIRDRVINNWETQIATEFLRKIRDGLLNNQYCQPSKLLRLYREILQQEKIAGDDSPEQTQLLDLGLVVRKEGGLRMASRLYETVFSMSWIDRQLANLSQPVTQKTPILNGRSPVLTAVSLKQKEQKKKPSIIVILLLLAIPSFIFIFVGAKFLFADRITSNFQQANELLSKGEYNKAIAKYNQVLKTDKNSYQAWTNLGYALAGLQEYEEMLEACTKAAQIQPQATYAWNCQGEALHNLNRESEAISKFDRGIEIDASEPIFWINKSESLLALKRSEEALETIDRAILLLDEIEKIQGKEKIAREIGISFNSKGRILAEMKQYEKALAAFDRSLEYDPNYFPAQRGRGLALKSLEWYDEANEQFENTLANAKLSDLQKAETWFYKGLTLCDWHQSGEAISAFEEALKLNPDYQAAKEAAMRCK
jgi:tetratricopeptide (TPR) repeat protein